MANPDYIVSSFLEVTQVLKFQHQWMSAETWAKIVVSYCRLHTSLTFEGKDLIQCISLNKFKGLTQQMDIGRTSIPHDHLSIFRERYRPKKQPTVHCFYETPKDEAPTRTGQNWFELISDGSELLNRIIQRSNTVQLTSATTMLATGTVPVGTGTRHDEPHQLFISMYVRRTY